VTLGVTDGSTRADYWTPRVARLDVVQLPGSHTGLLQPPNVRTVAEKMREAFENAPAAGRG
jgi:thioesterase domain-containing protein